VARAPDPCHRIQGRLTIRSGRPRGRAAEIDLALAIEQVLAALNSEKVRYLVVGGVAVVLHGHLRTTADLDLVVELAPDNARRAISALAGLGFRPRAPVPAEQFTDPVARKAWIDEKGLTVFSLWSDRLPEIEVDLFVNEPFHFEEAYARAVRVPLDTTTATVVSLEDLIALKQAAGRPIDLADVDALRALASGGGGSP
jgi:predicted nucleotidyltransferase